MSSQTPGSGQSNRPRRRHVPTLRTPMTPPPAAPRPPAVSRPPVPPPPRRNVLWRLLGLGLEVLSFIGVMGLIVLALVLLDVGDLRARLRDVFLPSPTPTVIFTPTITPTPTPTSTPTATFTPTNTPTPTVTPTPTIPPYVTVLTLVQRYAVLETVRYNYEKVVPVEFAQHMGGISGEKLLYVGVGYVSAGVNLGALNQNSIISDGLGNIVVILPPAYLTSCVLDAQRSYIYEHNVGVINFLYEALYDEPDLLEIAEHEAIIAFRDSALESGILEQARADVEWHLGAILSAAGFASVTFVQDDSVTPQHDATCAVER